jgi:hypothetical protein
MNARLTTAVLTVEVMSDIDNSLRRSERDISMLREGAPFGAMSASRTAGERPPYRTASELLVDHIERYLDYCEWDIEVLADQLKQARLAIKFGQAKLQDLAPILTEGVQAQNMPARFETHASAVERAEQQLAQIRLRVAEARRTVASLLDQIAAKPRQPIGRER